MTDMLVSLAQVIPQRVAAAGPLLSAIRLGPNRHITGLVCEGDVIVTTDQDLPALDRFTVVRPAGHLAAARPGPRDVGCNLAVLYLEAPWPVVRLDIANPAVGSPAVVIGADADASPTARLTVIHRLLRTAEALVPVLDLPQSRLDPGSLVLDIEGRLIGLAALGPGGEAVAIPGAAIVRMLRPTTPSLAPRPAPIAPPPPNRPGWLGLSLQPITVPEPLAARAGQSSGRMVVTVAKGGPAETAGLRVGDVLLALNDTSASGPHALRAFLESEHIGSTVNVRLLRDGTLLTTPLTIGPQPG